MLSTENWRVDLDGRYPIYQQIINQFSRALVKGEICLGEKIPSIRELSIALKVTTNTVQRAYQEMERNELIYSQRGRGYFVMENKEIITTVKKSLIDKSMFRFLTEMRALGFGEEEIFSELKNRINKGGIV